MSDQKTATPDAVIIGAGPIGIAAAAHLLARGLTPLVLEKGPAAGHAIREWGHVNVFTPWKHVTDKAVEALLAPTGWKLPDPEHLPTGQEIVDSYLVPAVTTAPLAYTCRGIASSDATPGDSEWRRFEVTPLQTCGSGVR